MKHKEGYLGLKLVSKGLEAQSIDESYFKIGVLYHLLALKPTPSSPKWGANDLPASTTNLLEFNTLGRRGYLEPRRA